MFAILVMRSPQREHAVLHNKVSAQKAVGHFIRLSNPTSPTAGQVFFVCEQRGRAVGAPQAVVLARCCVGNHSLDQAADVRLKHRRHGNVTMLSFVSVWSAFKDMAGAPSIEACLGAHAWDINQSRRHGRPGFPRVDVTWSGESVTLHPGVYRAPATARPATGLLDELRTQEQQRTTKPAHARPATAGFATRVGGACLIDRHGVRGRQLPASMRAPQVAPRPLPEWDDEDAQSETAVSDIDPEDLQGSMVSRLSREFLHFLNCFAHIQYVSQSIVHRPMTPGFGIFAMKLPLPRGSVRPSVKIPMPRRATSSHCS